MDDLPEEQAPLLVRHAESAMSGTVVCAAVIAAGAGHTETITGLVLAILVTVTAYWVVHLYAASLAIVIHHRHHPWLATRSAAAHTWPTAAVSLLPVGVLVAANLLGADVRDAALIALLSTVGLLALYGGVAGHRAGLRPAGVAVSVALGAGVGLAMVLLKAALH